MKKFIAIAKDSLRHNDILLFVKAISAKVEYQYLSTLWYLEIDNDEFYSPSLQSVFQEYMEIEIGK